LEIFEELVDRNEEMLLHHDYHDQNEEMILMMVTFAGQNEEMNQMMEQFVDQNEETNLTLVMLLDQILKMRPNDEDYHFLHHFHYRYWKDLHYQVLMLIEEDLIVHLALLIEINLNIFKKIYTYHLMLLLPIVYK
jgi:hypothetical protein